MKWGPILGIIVGLVLMVLYEWPKISGRKEKITFTLLTVVGFALSLLLVQYPELPGPTQLVLAIFKPLGKLLEK